MLGQTGSLFALTAILAGVAFALPPEKIIQGAPVTVGECPYIVSLRVHGKHVCGGTLVSDRHVVTAAHCLVGFVGYPYTELLVATGSLSSKSGHTHAVKAVFYHSRYNVQSTSSPHDIAVIALASPVSINEHQNILQLPTSVTPSGVTAFTAGWGLTTPNATQPADDLQKINITTMNPVQCQPYLIQMSRLYMGQICAWTAPGCGPCMGDSGGPLMYKGQLIGIVSYSGPCALGLPVVYTSVFHYVIWIKQVMTLV